ncbi:hypothetical protein CMK14_22450 [Candidatus Poribacteria bacterium]|nr:hypothetical protein [Candidatus Poribacteria bacterium]
MKSKTIIFTGLEQAELVEVDLLDEPAPHEFTIQTRVTLMSMGTELACYRADSEPGSHWHGWVKHPFFPGYSCVGEVIKVGSDIEWLRVGERIFHTTSHRQYANLSIPADQIVKVPDGVSDEEAVWSKLATITQTAVRQVEHAMGDRAVVIGQGPIGQLVTQYLRLLGLREILVIDQMQTRLDLALAHGATAGFNGSAAEAKDFVLEHTDGQLADAVYDATGHFSVLPLALPLARRYGTVMLLGDSPHPSRQHLTPDLLTRQIRLIGTHNESLPPAYAYWTPIRQQRLFLQYVQRQQMKVDDLITHRFNPDQASQVYADLNRDRSDSIGVIFKW